MVEGISSKKLFLVDPSPRILDEGINLILQSPRTSVVSMVGRKSTGKSTLMNSLLTQPVFYVNPNAIIAKTENTTIGIDIFKLENQIYLDCEGALNQGEDINKTLKMAAFVSCFSDTILVLVELEEHTNGTNIYDKFIMPLFFNNLMKHEARSEDRQEILKKNFVVVVRGLSGEELDSPEIDEIREEIKQRLDKEWDEAKRRLNELDEERERTSLDDNYNVRVEFVEFNSNKRIYERTEGIAKIIESDPKSTVRQRLEESKTYAETNILGDIDAAKVKLNEKKQEFRVQLKDIDLLDSELEDRIERIYEDGIKSLFCGVLYRPFERIKDNFISKAIKFRLEYMRIDIEYYRFKLELCKLLGTWFEKFKGGIVDGKKQEFERKMNNELNTLKFLDGSQQELIDMIRQRIKSKMNNFSDVFTSELSSQRIKDVGWYAFDIATLALPGFGAVTKTIPGLVKGLALTGRRAWKIGRVFIGIGIHSISSILNSGSLHLSSERQVEELENELEALLGEIDGAKESKAVYEIDKRLKGSLSPFDLENFLVPQERNQ